MRNASLYKVGGTALLLGAVLEAVAILLHAPQPMDLAAYTAIPPGSWMASHWMLAVSTVLLVGGLFALARHLFNTPGEGWAVVGLGVVIASGAAFVAIVAPEILAFPVLGQSAADPGAQHAFMAVNLNLMSLVHVAAPLFWGGVTCFAVAMLRDATFPRWVAQAGIVIGVVEILSGFFLGEQWTLFKLVFLVGCAWIAFVGNSMARVKTS